MKEVTIGAEETVLGETSVTEVGADVERLTVRLGIRVVAWGWLAIAHETGVGGEGEDGIVLAWSRSGNVIITTITDNFIIGLVKGVTPIIGTKIRIFDNF